MFCFLKQKNMFLVVSGKKKMASGEVSCQTVSILIGDNTFEKLER